jgi:predicted DNA binding CopG/RHH family protein
MNKEYEPEAREADEREYLVSSMEPTTDVELGPGPKAAIAIRLSGADVERLKARADSEGIGFTQLARQWILERLDEPSTVPAEAEAALATLRRFVSKTS